MFFTIIITIACYTFLLTSIELITKITRNSIVSSISKPVEGKGLTKEVLDKICKLCIILSGPINSTCHKVFGEPQKLDFTVKSSINNTYFINNLFIEFTPNKGKNSNICYYHLRVIDLEQQKVFTLIVDIFNEKDHIVKIYKPNFKYKLNKKEQFHEPGPDMFYEELNRVNLILKKNLKISK